MPCLGWGGEAPIGKARPLVALCDAGVTKISGDAEKGMSDDIEQGSTLQPRYDANGLVTAVVTDHASGEVLMLAHMNADALGRTIESGEAWFWSRSRGRLWKKGESSGNVLRVIEMRVDCDQDAIWIRAEAAGPACHTGERSCFYRRIEGGRLVRNA
jgi:phosphoribosyl-AMP cyclohydrolase